MVPAAFGMHNQQNSRAKSPHPGPILNTAFVEKRPGDSKMVLILHVSLDPNPTTSKQYLPPITASESYAF